MEEIQDAAAVGREHRNRMLKLVSKGFYRELINYGVGRQEIMRVASHLLDNLLTHWDAPGRDAEYYNRLFRIEDVDDRWASERRLRVEDVELRPVELCDIPLVARWLREPTVRHNLVPAFPDDEGALRAFFTERDHAFFTIRYGGEHVGLIGADNIDETCGRLEMKKFVGNPAMHGKGIGKRATFAFLYYAFMLRDVHKVYIHSREVNVRNINLNARFGFELEGVFFEEVRIGDTRQDIVRMALRRPLWLEIFSARAAGRADLATAADPMPADADSSALKMAEWMPSV
jgi:RimJ/RimL family protein N-acetyltransferase